MSDTWSDKQGAAGMDFAPCQRCQARKEAVFRLHAGTAVFFIADALLRMHYSSRQRHSGKQH